MRANRIAVSALTLLLAAACSGPSHPFNVGVKNVATDVVLSNPKAVELAPPIPPVSPVIPGPVPDLGTGSPLPEPTEVPTLPPLTCPQADPLSVPEQSAPDTIAALPVPAAYRYRTSGTFEISGAQTSKGSFPRESTRSVEVPSRAQPPLPNEDPTFDVVTSLGTTSTRTSYRLTTTALEVTRVETTTPLGVTVFSPRPALVALPLPALPGTRWHAFGVDPITGVAQTYNGVVNAHERIDACGSLIDTVSVHLDGDVGSRCVDQNNVPRLCSPPLGTEAVLIDSEAVGTTSFVADQRYATQYGGLIVADHLVAAATSVDGNSVQDLRSTITRVPLAGKTG